VSSTSSSPVALSALKCLQDDEALRNPSRRRGAVTRHEGGLSAEESAATRRALLRRRQVRPQDGTRLSVDAPGIDEVFDLESGEVVRSEAVIGTDYARLIQLRLRVQTQMRRGEPLYRCPHCGVVVHICRSWKEPKFFFKHRHEDGNCPAITAGKLSQDEIDARRYNGVKESRLHIQMKEALFKCLSADPAFSDIRVEQVWRGGVDVRVAQTRRPGRLQGAACGVRDPAVDDLPRCDRSTARLLPPRRRVAVLGIRAF